MSEPVKRSLQLTALGVLVLVAGWALVAQAGPRAPAVDREIRLEARGMAFYLPGDPTPNPALEVVAGERVRLVLTNRTPGMEHDLTVGGLERATRKLASGETGSLVLRVPAVPADYDYLCLLHAQTMRGRLRVVAAAGAP